MASHTTRLLATASGALLLALLPLTGCGGSDETPQRNSFPLAADQLTVTTDGGNIDVRPADVDEVEVARWLTKSGIGPDPTATWGLTGDTLTLTTNCLTIFGGCEARYEILVPNDVKLTVNAENGSITAAGFETALRIRTENGAVSADDVAGDLTLESDNGQLHATGTRSGQVNATSHNGEIQLSFAAIPDQVDVASQNGDVTIEVPDAGYHVTTETDSGEVNVDMPQQVDSRHTITARTDNGAITLRTFD